MEFRDSHNNTVLRISGDKCYNANGTWVYAKKGNYICNASGNWVYEIRGDKVFDTRGNWVYKVHHNPNQPPVMPVDIKDTVACTHCGHELKHTQKFCTKCGVQTSATASGEGHAYPTAPAGHHYASASTHYAPASPHYSPTGPDYAPAPQKSRVPLMIASIVVVAALGIGAAFFFTNWRDNAVAGGGIVGCSIADGANISPDMGGATDGIAGLSRLWDLIVGEWIQFPGEADDVWVFNRDGTVAIMYVHNDVLHHYVDFYFDIRGDYSLILYGDDFSNVFTWWPERANFPGYAFTQIPCEYWVPDGWFVSESYFHVHGETYKRR